MDCQSCFFHTCWGYGSRTSENRNTSPQDCFRRPSNEKYDKNAFRSRKEDGAWSNNSLRFSNPMRDPTSSMRGQSIWRMVRNSSTYGKVGFDLIMYDLPTCEGNQTNLNRALTARALATPSSRNRTDIHMISTMENITRNQWSGFQKH